MQQYLDTQLTLTRPAMLSHLPSNIPETMILHELNKNFNDLEELVHIFTAKCRAYAELLNDPRPLEPITPPREQQDHEGPHSDFDDEIAPKRKRGRPPTRLVKPYALRNRRRQKKLEANLEDAANEADVHVVIDINKD